MLKIFIKNERFYFILSRYKDKFSMGFGDAEFFFYVEYGLPLRSSPFMFFCSYSSCEGANHSREEVDFSTSFCTLFVDFSLKAKMAKQFVKVALVVARSGTGLYLMVIDYGDIPY